MSAGTDNEELNSRLLGRHSVVVESSYFFSLAGRCTKERLSFRAQEFVDGRIFGGLLVAHFLVEVGRFFRWCLVGLGGARL